MAIHNLKLGHLDVLVWRPVQGKFTMGKQLISTFDTLSTKCPE